MLLSFPSHNLARVRLSNMHRVYGADASMDPTKIETIVVKQCAERKARHEQRNQERKLTPQEKREKKKNKLLADRVNEITVCVFKVFTTVCFTN